MVYDGSRSVFKTNLQVLCVQQTWEMYGCDSMPCLDHPWRIIPTMLGSYETGICLYTQLVGG